MEGTLSLCWTPVHLPPEPLSLYTPSSAMFTKIMNMLKAESIPEACTGTDTCSNGPPGELELRYRGGGGFKPPQIEKHALTSIRKEPKNYRTPVVPKLSRLNLAPEIPRMNYACHNGNLVRESLGEQSTQNWSTTSQNQKLPGTSRDRHNRREAKSMNLPKLKHIDDFSQHHSFLKQKKITSYIQGNKTDKATEIHSCDTDGRESTDVELDEWPRNLEELKSIMDELDEVAVTLVFSDGSTQLRRKRKKKQSSGDNVIKPTYLSVAYPLKSNEDSKLTLHFCDLPMATTDQELCVVVREMMEYLLRKRIIVYKGKEVIVEVLKTFADITPEVWRDWNLFDTRIGAWLLNADHTPASFSDLLAQHGFRQLDTHNSADKEKSGLDWSEIHQDLALLGPLMVKLYTQLMDESLLYVFIDMEVKLIPILAGMEVRGLCVDCPKLIQYGDILKKKISTVEAAAHKAAGRIFPINSTQQLRQCAIISPRKVQPQLTPEEDFRKKLKHRILFEELHLDNNKKLTRTQVRHHTSTSEAVLTQLSELHPLPAIVLEYRHLCKLHATYVTGLMPYITEGIMKPTWLHTSAATGRLAACNPNIQGFPRNPINIGVVDPVFIVGKQPVNVEINVRDAVVSRPGFTFLATDYKSIELRVLAHLSEDACLLSAFNSSHKSLPNISDDIFVNLSSEWLGMDINKVTSEDRYRTKHIAYAVIYGVGKDKLGDILKESPSMAKELTKSFLSKFSGVQQYIHNSIAKAKSAGYLHTLFGRKRYFTEINSANPMAKSHAERQAVNFPVQGSAADICKLGMIAVTDMLSRKSPNSRLVVQIHDELILEVPDEDVPQVHDCIKRLLEDTQYLHSSLKVPLEVKITAGKTWGSLSTVVIAS